jgi:putative FmdB family regulatory protein
MPIYEYRCRDCKRRSEILTFRISEDVAVKCNHCGSPEVERILSRVRVRMSEETRMERLGDPSRFAGLDENDPKSMAKWMKDMGREMGDDLGEDFDVDAMMEEAMEEKESMEGGAPSIADSAAGDGDE